jgi:hypothetical protein
MATQKDHFLTDPLIQAGIALLAPYALGVGFVMAYPPDKTLFWLGVFLAAIGIAFTFWLGLHEVTKRTAKGFFLYGFAALESVIIVYLVYPAVYSHHEAAQPVVATTVPPTVKTTLQPVNVTVLFSDHFHFQTIAIPYDTIRQMNPSQLLSLKDRERREAFHHIQIPLSMTNPIIDITVKNDGETTINNALVHITCNLPIIGETNGVEVFSNNEISYSGIPLESEPETGIISDFSVSVDLSSGEPIAAFQVGISADGYQTMWYLIEIEFDRVANPINPLSAPLPTPAQQ